MRASRIFALVAVVAVVGLGLYAGPRFLGLPANAVSGPVEDQKGVLASFIERILSSPGMQVSIDAVDGALSSDATIRGVVLSDAQGPWLKLDRARLIWTRSALLRGRLLVDRLDIGHLEFLRKPLPSPDANPTPAATEGPLLPSLPVQVNIGEFKLEELSLGEPVLGVAARLDGQGRAALGRPSDGLDLSFDLQRLDAPGTLSLRLAYAPGSTALKIAATVHEPAKGLIAHAAGLSGLPPVDLDFAGDGPLDAFRAKLNFTAGDLATVDGAAQLDRREASRALTLDLTGRVEKLLPPWLGPVFVGPTQVAGGVIFADDGSYGAEDLRIVAKGARLDVNGRLGADNALDGQISLRALDDGGGVARAGDVEIGALTFEARASGQLQAPRLDAQLHVADAKAPAVKIGRLDATLTTVPNGVVTDAATKIEVAADASGEGLALTDAGLAQALGDHFKFTLRAQATPTGESEVSVAKLTAASGEASASGHFGVSLVKGKLEFSAPELARFAELTGVALTGSAKGTADLEGAPNRGQINAGLAISTEKLATGIELADGLIGGRLEITGDVHKSRDGLGFSALKLASRNLTARLDGEATHQAADVAFTAEAPDLGAVSKKLAGKAQAQGRLTGTLDHPDAAFTLSLADARAMDRPIPRLVLDAKARDILGALEARVTLDGVIDRKPATGAVNFARGADQSWRFSAEDLKIGANSLAGAGTLSSAQLLDGSFDLKAGDLADLSPMALQPLAGRIDAKLDFSARDGKQGGAVVAKGAGLRFGDLASIDRLDVDARVSDLFGAPRIDGTMALDRATFAGENVPQVRASAKASEGGSDFTVNAEARGFALESRGRLVASDPVRVDLAAFEARRDGQRITLAGPARIAFPAGGVQISSLALLAGSGRLNIEGSIGQQIDLSLNAKGLPLTLARLAAPNLELAGTLDAVARIRGAATAPTGDWRVDLVKLAAPQMRNAGLAAVDVHATGRLANGRSSLAARLELPKGGSLRVDGSVPLDPKGSIDLAFRGGIDASLANIALANSGRTLAGRLAIDARAQGSVAQPQVTGSATLSGGAFADPLLGVRIDKVEAVVRARGDNVTIERFSGATTGGGTLAASGTVRLAPDAGFPASIRVTSHNAELVSNDIVTVVANLALDLSGPLATRPRIGGRVSLVSMDVRLPERLPASSRPLEDLVHIDPGPAAEARLALARKRALQRRQAPPFNADLNVVLSAPSHIFVRGRGVDAELGGELTLTGTLASPLAQGGFQMRRGQFSIAGKTLQFSRGKIGFAGDVIPELDFVAQTSTSDVTVQVAITGPANQPVFTFSSTPDLPQDEVLSRLLFSSASGGLSPLQAVQLAQTVAEYSGIGGGAGILEKMRRSLGLDSLNVLMGADGSPSAGASRYLSQNLNVGVRVGARPQDSGVTMGLDVTKRLRLQGSANADGSTSVGVATQWEY